MPLCTYHVMLGTLSYYNQLHIVAYCKPINVGIEKYRNYRVYPRTPPEIEQVSIERQVASHILHKNIRETYQSLPSELFWILTSSAHHNFSELTSIICCRMLSTSVVSRLMPVRSSCGRRAVRSTTTLLRMP